MPPHRPFSRHRRPIRRANRRKRVVGPRSKKNKPKPLVWAEIDLNKLRGNLKAIRSMVAGSRTKTLAVVKADAYGHGLKEIARTLKGEGVRFFGVANVEEALELRQVVGRGPRILVLGSFSIDDRAHYARFDLTPTLSSIDDARRLFRELKKPLRVQVKIDTGMGRLGVWHPHVRAFFSALKKMGRSIIVEGVYTHLASADESDKSASEEQIRFFNEAVKTIKALGFSPRYVHAANSAGVARFKQSHLNLVRPGILLYGVMPGSAGKAAKRLRPILELKTRISFLKPMSKGRSVSYGATWRASKDTLVATLPVGYSHGYGRGLSNKGWVSIRGRLCPVIGRVTMDQTLVDVGHLPIVRRWDEVTLIGTDGKAQVTASDLAQITGTIPYEIFCSLHQRIPRVYKGIRP